MPTHRSVLPQPVFNEPAFAEDHFTPDPTTFDTRHPSDDALYRTLGDLLKKDVVDFDASRLDPDQLYTLAEALGPQGPDMVKRIRDEGQIVFHSVGDTGASNVRKYKSELRVADQMAEDCHTSEARERPSFFYHLGDIVYSFGEKQYYYDQFYEPYRDYPAPIFAIPGNHDSFTIPGKPPADAPLATFTRNFCSKHPIITQEAASLHRTAMTQPGVYFTLDAPFVRIIGLFSNALEDPGLISSESGKWPGVPELQLEFLEAQLKRIKSEGYKGAVLLAMHHPPFSYSPKAGNGRSNHGSSTAMLREIDAICKRVGVYPHAVLSGHAHNYQRYTRTVAMNGSDYDVPFIVCGNGGHNVNPLVRGRGGEPAREPRYGHSVKYLDAHPAIDTSELLLEKYDDRDYGYLRISVDSHYLRVGFHHVGGLAQSRFDYVTVQLSDHTMVAN